MLIIDLGGSGNPDFKKLKALLERLNIKLIPYTTGNDLLDKNQGIKDDKYNNLINLFKKHNAGYLISDDPDIVFRSVNDKFTGFLSLKI